MGSDTNIITNTLLTRLIYHERETGGVEVSVLDPSRLKRWLAISRMLVLIVAVNLLTNGATRRWLLLSTDDGRADLQIPQWQHVLVVPLLVIVGLEVVRAFKVALLLMLIVNSNLVIPRRLLTRVEVLLSILGRPLLLIRQLRLLGVSIVVKLIS